MIRLHHCVSARSFRVLWMLEELGLPYELTMLPFPPRVNAREFMVVNPLGTVPLFDDDGRTMTESSAICQYLAARHGRDTIDVSVESPDYGTYLQWLYFGEATLTFPLTLVLRYTAARPAMRPDAQAVRRGSQRRGQLAGRGSRPLAHRLAAPGYAGTGMKAHREGASSGRVRAPAEPSHRDAKRDIPQRR